MSLIIWLIIGLIAGFVARAVVPGNDSMGVVGTIVLGLIGSLIGGFLGNLIGGDGNFPGDLWDPAGIIGSIIGAIVALFAYKAMSSRTA